MTRGSIQEDVTSVTMHAPNTRAPKYTRQMLTDTEGEISKAVVVETCHPTHINGQRSRQKINKKTLVLNDIVAQLNLI